MNVYTLCFYITIMRPFGFVDRFAGCVELGKLTFIFKTANQKKMDRTLYSLIR